MTAADQLDITPECDHALPAKHFDRLMTGIPEDQLDVRLVYNAFVSIAMSVQRRGWTQTEFTEMVTGETWRTVNGAKMRRCYGLWSQLYAMSRHPFTDLDSVWERAAANLRGDGMWTYEDVRANAVERAYAWADRLLVGVDGLDDTDILVMDYVIVWTEKRGRSEVTCPCRDVADHAGISKDTAYRRLKALTERRLLILVSCGHASKKQFVGSKTKIIGGKAAIYRLDDPYDVRSPSYET